LLDAKITKKITDLVHAKPRTIDEIAKAIGKNWRTADRYIERISEETGTIAVRTFREGSRGALKIVYLNNTEKISSTEFQERLLHRILAGKTKDDFSPFDIYQYVDAEHRSAFMERQPEDSVDVDQDFISMFSAAQEQVMIFSGNLSWANVTCKKVRVIDALKELAKRGVPVKIITRVDIASLKNLAKVQQINEDLGREAIEIRHAAQPLRCLIIDNKHARLKEIKRPELYKKGELCEKTHIFYNIYDEEWVEWLQKVFWKMFGSAIPAARRLETIESIQKVPMITRKEN
jgi:phosphatidylserine/phosphatidylglycerophosphate/cardiolipin synthase-like enzyme